MNKITNELLQNAGFKLTQYEDGMFWVIEEQAGKEAERIAKICSFCSGEIDDCAVCEILILQCGENFENPVLYVDGYCWDLKEIEFYRIVLDLIE